jgi:phosphatidylglycerol:prolipoprotein diacylglycerol transferase
MNWWVEFSVNIRPQLEIGSLRLNYYGLIIGTGIIIALWLVGIRANQYQLNKNDVETLVWWSLIPGLIGARIYHVFDNISYYLWHPFDIVAIWNGGLAIYGGLLGGLLGIKYAAKKQRINLGKVLDLLSPYVLLAQAIGRWGNFFNMEGYGPPTDLPWKIYISASKRIAPYLEEEFFHPLFLYESLWNFLIFILLLLITKTKPNTGITFGLYLISYGVGRFFIEFGRLDTAIIGGFKLAQGLSLIVILIGFRIMIRGHLNPHLVKLGRK